MQTLGELLPKVANQIERAPQSLATPSGAVTLKANEEARLELSTFLFQCFDSLKLYGKEPEQMAATNSMFQLVLADYTIEQVRQAFAFYLRYNSEMPAPADIANIIERGGKPPFERSVYIAIGKKHPEDRTSEEWHYKKDYERFMITGKN